MVYNLTQTSVALAIGAILLFATTGQYAFGDIIHSDIIESSTLEATIFVGQSITVDYWITQQPATQDGQSGCNAADGSSATITPTVSAGVTKSPNSRSYSACGGGLKQSIMFTGTAANDYSISVTVSDSGAGSYDISGASILLHVLPVDSTGPVISKTITGTLGDNDWYTSDVAVDWTVSDPESAVVIDSGCADTTITTDTAGVTLDCFAHSAGGSSSDSVTIKRDATAPIISGNAAPAPNGAGWNNGDVTVTFTCSDAMSGISSCTADVSVGEGASQSVDGTAADYAGNTAMATVSGINVDMTAPTISADVSPAANANNWHNADVTITFTCADGLSGLKSCTPAVTLTSEGAGQMATGEAIDNADNSASITVENINIDKTAPTISASRTPAANINGWNNGPVSVDFDCSDSLSGIDSCGPDAILSGEGAAQSVLGTALDLAGNSDTATVIDINIDLTAPVNVAFTDGSIADGAEYYFGFVPDGPTMCSAEDALSGFDHCDVTGGGTTVGDHEYTATAYDRAGNSVIATIMYTINPWTIHGFYQPVDMGANVYNAVKGGSTVPLKFEVYAGPTELTDTWVKNYLSAKKVTCGGGGVIDDIEEYTSTGQTIFRYDAEGGQFIDNWKVPSVAKGTCYEVKLLTIDGTSIAALFKIK